MLPWCNSATMSLHLAEVSQAVSPGAHAVVLLDQAGWHTSPKLNVPANISLLALPPKSPELNPTENVWQYLRDNWLSNRVFTSGRDIVDHCCDAWNRLIDQPWTIMSIGLRDAAFILGRCAVAPQFWSIARVDHDRSDTAATSPKHQIGF